MNTGPELYKRAKTLIPGGTQLISKKPEKYHRDKWPAYYQRAHGIEVTDLDGKRYLDMGTMGLGACILGYRDRDVDRAVKQAVDRGVSSSLMAPEEIELAELLCELHPWAGMVRYARTGGEAMAIAVRIARAQTGRDKVAFCGYHGWCDWYLAANLSHENALRDHLMPGLNPAGVPRALSSTAFPFHYNRLDELKTILEEHGATIGTIVMEPQRGQAPEDQFLEKVRKLASKIGAVLIFDEITTGFRMTCGGIHLIHGVDPDIAVFAKSMATGYAMAAVIGRPEVMEFAQRSFVSSTNWTELIGPSAALATIKKCRRVGVARHICSIGRSVQDGWRQIASDLTLPLVVEGLPCLPEFSIKHSEAAAFQAEFVAGMLDKGFLAFHQFKPSWAHQPSHVDQYLDASRGVFDALARSEAPSADVVKAEGGFRRLT